MSVSPIFPTEAAGAGAAQTATSAARGGNGALDADFTTFLNLLTAQLKNQDPLKPLESTAFIAQLAQFSSVEQQIATNQGMQSLIGILGGDVSDLASWLGAEVESEAGGRFAGDPLTFRAEEITQGGAKVVVSDSSGAEVVRFDAPAGAATISWDGTLSNGGVAAEGVYTARLETTPVGGEPRTTPLVAFSAVAEARVIDGAPHLVLDNGARIALSEVKAVRRPE